jgi:hypothetical protein
MSANADNLPIEDVFPVEAQVSTPVIEEPVVPPVEETPKPEPVVQDKQPQNVPHPQIPKWRLDEVLEQNRALKAQLAQAPVQPQPQQAQSAQSAPKEEDYPDWASYNAAVVAHTVQQELQKRDHVNSQQAQARQHHERVVKAESTWEEKVYAETAKDPSFQEALMNAPALRPDLQLMLKESDDPIALAKFLTANPDKIIALNRMPYEQGIRELGRTEARLTTVTAGPSKIPAKQAPNLDPVTGGNTPPPKSPYSPQSSEVDYLAATRRLPQR